MPDTMHRRETTVSLEHNKQLARRFIDEILNDNNWSVIPEVVHPDYELRESGMTFHGGEALKKGLQILNDIMLGYNVTVEDEVAEGDRVMVRMTVRGQSKGPFLGLPPNGQSLEFPAMWALQFKDGKVYREWVVSDALTLLRQMGGTERDFRLPTHTPTPAVAVQPPRQPSWS
jgi:steroid delta-isomerase-like uncharacterized protein